MIDTASQGGLSQYEGGPAEQLTDLQVDTYARTLTPNIIRTELPYWRRAISSVIEALTAAGVDVSIPEAPPQRFRAEMQDRLSCVWEHIPGDHGDDRMEIRAEFRVTGHQRRALEHAETLNQEHASPVEQWTPDEDTARTARQERWVRHWRDLALPRCQRRDGERDQQVVTARVTVLLADEVLRLRDLVEHAMRERHPDAVRVHLDDRIELDTLTPDEETAACEPFGWVVCKRADG